MKLGYSYGTVYNRTHQATSQLQGGEGETETPQSLTLVDHYVALVLAVFIENGLLEVRYILVLESTVNGIQALVSVIEEDTTVVNRKATLLLGEVLQLANRILPSQFAAQLQVSCRSHIFPLS